jgi:hypothetical protein
MKEAERVSGAGVNGTVMPRVSRGSPVGSKGEILGDRSGLVSERHGSANDAFEVLQCLTLTPIAARTPFPENEGERAEHTIAPPNARR